jgi:hypothetical protein
MKMRLKAMALAGIGLTAFTLLQGCDDRELTRRRALEVLSAELVRQGPVTEHWLLEASDTIRTRTYVDVKEVTTNLEKLVRMPDDQYTALLKGASDSKGSEPTTYGIPIDHNTIQAMRKLWKTGHISRFDWTSESLILVGGLDLWVVGVIKPEAQSMCDGKPYHEGDKSCVRIVAERKVKSITGIRDFGEFVKVEFDATITPTSAGVALGRKTVTKSFAAGFVLYDDGWRVLHAIFPVN